MHARWLSLGRLGELFRLGRPQFDQEPTTLSVAGYAIDVAKLYTFIQLGYLIRDVLGDLLAWGRWLRVFFPGVLLGVLLTSAPAHADAYFNSAEANCFAGNSVGYVMCEDFETAGHATFGVKWTVCADLVNGTAGIPCGNTFDNCTKGWAGLGNAGSSGGLTQAGVGLSGSTAGVHNWFGPGTCSGSGAQHGLYPSLANVTTLYVRWYQKWPTGYAFGAEKVMTFNANNPGDPGIKWGNVHMNCGASGVDTVGDLQWQPQPVTGFPITNSCISTGVRITTGVWWALQARVTIPTNATTADATVQIWQDNCGADGTSCTGSPTLRLNTTVMAMNRNASTEQIHNIWFEIFSNPQSTCVTTPSQANCPLVDNIVMATSGPIPFVGVSSPPPPSPTIAIRAFLTSIMIIMASAFAQALRARVI